MKVLTVTVPSYNAEKFLVKGIPTLLDERILDDIEIVIVDDGSTDNTADIADKYQSNYPDTVKVIHKENGGHGSAVNSGINEAAGKYFCVIDADDWVDTDNFVRLVQYMKTCHSDLILADMVKVNFEDKVLDYGKVKGLPDSKEVLLDDYIGTVHVFGMHNYFISSAILKKKNVRCREHCFYVDNEYVLYSLIHVRTVTYINITVYHYLFGREDQSASMNSRRKNLNQLIVVIDSLIVFFNQNYQVMTVNQRKYYASAIEILVQGIYGTLLSFNKEEKKNEMVRYDKNLLEKSTHIYYANRSLGVKLLRLSQFKCYKLMAIIYRTVRM